MSDSTRPLPNAVETEKRLLSICFQHPKPYISQARADGITKESFYRPSHQTLWGILSKLEKAGRADEIELITLTEQLSNAGILESMGGPAELTGIYTAVPTSGNFPHYCGIVREKAALRKTIEVCTDVIQQAYEDQDANAALRSLCEATSTVQRVGSAKRAAKPMTVALEAFVDDWKARASGDKSHRLSTGIHELDEITDGGLGKTWSCVICGVTKGGKTALATQVALNMILDGHHVVLFSMEMSTIELMERMLANMVNVPLPVMTHPGGNLSPDEETRTDQIRRVQRGIGKLSEFENVWFVDDTRMGIEELSDEVRNLDRIHGVDVLVCDYIQLVRGAGRESREREVAHVSSSLKRLAMELDLCSINLAQLNDDGKMRESRTIGQDANIVIETTKEEGLHIIAQRQGRAGVTLPLKLNGTFMRFERSEVL